jgi:hypothetical protein
MVKLRVIKGTSMWDIVFENTHRLINHMEFYLEFDHLYWKVRRNLDEINNKVTHRDHVVGVVIKVIIFLLNKVPIS